MSMPKHLRQHKRSAIGGHAHALVGHVTCEACGKKAYHSRKDAKAVVKAMRLADPGTTVEPYPCEALDGMWHVGSSHRIKDARRGGPPPGIRPQ